MRAHFACRLTALRRTLFTAFVLATSFATTVAAAAADACFPACRKGYVCAPDKRCVSECNPPCESNELCSGGVCHANPAMVGDRATPAAAPAATLATTPAQPPAPSDIGRSERAQAKIDAVPLPRLTFSVLVGPAGVKIGRGNAFGGEVAFQARYGLGADGGHGLVAGLRGGAYDYSYAGAFGPVSYFMGRVGLDLGYSGRYRFSGGNAGPLLLLSPQLVYANKPGYGVGATVGGRVQFGESFELQLPLTFAGIFASSSNAPNGFMFHASLLGGLTF
jgi:hypothetical protein